jgi:hypothetical protein
VLPSCSPAPVQTRTCAYTVRRPGTSVWIALISAILSTLLFGAGCAAENGTADETSEKPVQNHVVLGAETKIFGGAQDNDAKAAAGVVALRVGTDGDYELCSGALLAPNVVLTARHCVAKSLTTSVSCDENGESTNGKHVDGNLKPSAISVYTGANPRFSEDGQAVGKTIISRDSSTLCDEDIALVVLDKEITDVEPLAVRIGAKAAVIAGETVKSVGYGQNDKKMPLGTRLRKDNVAVLAMGRGISDSKTALGRHEFEVGMSICEGDSGGPALSEETGAIIGVVSRGGNCNDDYGHIYTATSDFKDLFDKAFQAAGGAPIVEEGQPEGTQTAAHPVAVREPAPASVDAQLGTAPKAGGCSAAPTRGVNGSLGTAGLLLGLALVLRRRVRGC